MLFKPMPSTLEVGKIRFLLLFVGVLLLSVVAFWPVLAATFQSSRLPLWDMAAHGHDGVRLAESLRQFDLVGFFIQVYGMSLWPPAFPILETPFLLVFGDDYWVPRLVVGVLGILVVPLMVLIGKELDARWGIATGLLAAAALLASPMHRLFSALIMLEVPGALLFLLAMLMALRSMRTRSRTAVSYTHLTLPTILRV